MTEFTDTPTLEPKARPPRSSTSFKIGWIVIFGLVFGLLVLVGIGLNRAMRETIAEDEAAPDFTLTTFDGQALTLSDLKGYIVVVNFWASWCKPCEQEAADLQAAWEFYEGQGEVIFLGIDYVDTEPEAMKYIEKFSITYPNGPDLGTRISQAFRISGVPETYVIDKDGEISHRQIGPFVSLAQITNAIDPLLDN